MKTTIRSIVALAACGIPIPASLAEAAQKPDAVLFEDAPGRQRRAGWRIAPGAFADLPGIAPVFRLECPRTGCAVPRPWVGDQSWRDYRLEIEVLPESGFAGLDFHVQEDGWGAANVHFLATRGDGQEALQSGGVWGDVVAWKLSPYAPRSRPFPSGRWVKLRIDAGQQAANVYVNPEDQPDMTFRVVPFSRGGVRLWVYNGAACFRNLRVTALAEGSVKPVLKDPWSALSGPGVIRRWRVSPAKPAGFGRDSTAQEILSTERQWREAEADPRGILNLTALFPKQNTKHVVFAKTVLHSGRAGTRKAWVTYTDRFKLWCNGAVAFEGPPRGWFDPDRGKLGNSRLVPDQFEIALPLNRGDNLILVRAEVTEPFGWGFWMRLEQPPR